MKKLADLLAIIMFFVIAVFGLYIHRNYNLSEEENQILCLTAFLTEIGLVVFTLSD